MLETVRRRESSPEVVELEEREYELWLEYRQLDRQAQMLAERGTREQKKRANRRAVRAHAAHQRCVNKILSIHQDRLFAEARDG